MTAAHVSVRRAVEADQDRLGRALAGAFADDPVFSWLIPPDVRNRQTRLELFFTSIARSYLRRNKHVYSGPDGVAAALWAQPGQWRLPVGEILRESVPNVRAFGSRLPLALRSLSAVEGKHPHDPHHWYLGYLGTEPGNQGRGIGGALLREVLTPCNEAGHPAYLESSNERNLTLYERHGFRVVEEMGLPGGGPTVWRMWRDPQG